MPSSHAQFRLSLFSSRRVQTVAGRRCRREGGLEVFTPSKEERLTRLGRITKVSIVAAVAAMAMSALVASAASAALVPAKFSTSSFKLTSTGVTVKGNGIEPKTCIPSVYIEGYAEANNFMATNPGYAETKYSCTGSTAFSVVLVGQVQYDTVAGKYIVHVNDFPSWSLNSPFGSYSQVSGASGGGGSNATWVNGSGATASTITFVNQTLGWTYAGSKKITLDGVFKATTTSGGLLTLSH